MPRRCRRPMPPQPTTASLMRSGMRSLPIDAWDPRREPDYSAGTSPLRDTVKMGRTSVYFRGIGGYWGVLGRTSAYYARRVMPPDQEGTRPEIGFERVTAQEVCEG